MSVTLENHHPDKVNQPNYTVPITHKEHRKLHRKTPIDTPLARKMRQYDKITIIIAAMKNWQTGYEKDFDDKPDIGLVQATHLKEKLMKEITIILGSEIKKVNHIKGFGPRCLAGILAYAHPSRFPSLRKYLFYCGYTEASRKNKCYRHSVKGIMFLLVGNLMKQKDKHYYPMYLEFKEKLRVKFPTKPKMAIHMIAINRTATFILKEVYQIWRVE